MNIIEWDRFKSEIDLCNRTTSAKFRWLIKRNVRIYVFSCEDCAWEKEKNISATTWQLYNHGDVKYYSIFTATRTNEKRKNSATERHNHFSNGNYKFFFPMNLTNHFRMQYSLMKIEIWYLQRFWQLGRYVKRLVRTFWLFVISQSLPGARRKLQIEKKTRNNN